MAAWGWRREHVQPCKMHAKAQTFALAGTCLRAAIHSLPSLQPTHRDLVGGTRAELGHCCVGGVLDGEGGAPVRRWKGMCTHVPLQFSEHGQARSM